MSEPSGGEQINWNQSTPIAVPTPTTEARVAIRRLDWSRIRRNLLRCNEPQLSLSVWYSIWFGFSASSSLSIAPIAVTKDLPVWVLPAYILTTLFSLLLGIVLVWLDKRLNRQRRSQIIDLDTDMDEIERTFDAQGVEGKAP
jgi:hypothetical protein